MPWWSTGIAAATLAPGGSREVMLEMRSVLLVNIEGSISAVEATCPHLGGILADGKLEGPRLTCPEHGAVFDAPSGKVIADPFGVEPPDGAVDPLMTFPTRIVAGLIEVELA